MSEPPARRAPPGWYSEHGRSGYRYWDGESWVDSPGGAVGIAAMSGGNRPSLGRQGMALPFMGAAVALLIAGLFLPWAEADSGKQGVLDGDIPWWVGVGSVADTWLLIVATAVVLWALLISALAGNGQPMWLTIVVTGLFVMAFCVAEGLAMDDDLDAIGAEVGSGLFLAYAGGAAAAISGVLLKPLR